jgi:hypothetical protein
MSKLSIPACQNIRTTKCDRFNYKSVTPAASPSMAAYTERLARLVYDSRAWEVAEDTGCLSALVPSDNHL